MLCLFFFSKENTVPLDSTKVVNEKRFQGISTYCSNFFKWTKNASEADFIVLPRKYNNSEVEIQNKYLDTARKNNKKLLLFQIDDSEESFLDIPNTILYKTSILKSKKSRNIRSMPAFVDDIFDGTIMPQPILSIGYCGHTEHGREKYIKALINSDIKTDFILREGFWAPELKDKVVAKSEFDRNIRRNLFTFCHRGAGNFSYRFYETLMHGRIPLLIDTDCELPFHEYWKTNYLGPLTTRLEPKDLSGLISKYYDKASAYLHNIQIDNRILWEHYFSPRGFINSLHKDLLSDV